MDGPESGVCAFTLANASDVVNADDAIKQWDAVYQRLPEMMRVSYLLDGKAGRVNYRKPPWRYGIRPLMSISAIQNSCRKNR